jgi:hypothetical protein
MPESAAAGFNILRSLTLRISRDCAIACGGDADGARESEMKTLIYGVAIAAVATAGLATAGAAADRRVEPQATPAVAQFSYSPVAMPPLLPRRHRNHCIFYEGHYVCADHCGTDYQVYYCPNHATGCCHVGLGYCDAAGRLRCAPALF